ncbi:glucokinase [Thermodesulfobacteriota bacterium]
MDALKGKKYVLAGDIGGTKTNLGLFKIEGSLPVQSVVRKFASRNESGLEKIIERFLQIYDVHVESACFGIAGPVIRGRCRTTNLPWDVSEKKIIKRFGWDHAKLVNDLEAMAFGIPRLSGTEVYSLNKKRIKRDESFSLIAPGTGLGMVLSLRHDGKYIMIPSEGGHAGFSPDSKEECYLWESLHKRYGHVSLERVLSGPGLLNIFMWLRDKRRYKEPKWLSERMKRVDPAMAITQAAMENRTPICVKTLETFVSALGSAAGNLALTGMTLGGVYLGGGIPAKILPLLKSGRFMRSFVDKGRFTDILREIGVRVVLDEKASLSGAAHIAFNMTK